MTLANRPDRETLIDLYVNQGLTLAEIGARYNTSKQSVSLWFRGEGLGHLLAHGRQKYRDQARENLIYEHCVAGDYRENAPALVEELNTSERTLRKKAVRLGAAKHFRDSALEQHIIALRQQGLSQREIAQQTGLTQWHVSSILLRHGIRSRRSHRRRR